MQTTQAIQITGRSVALDAAAKWSRVLYWIVGIMILPARNIGIQVHRAVVGFGPLIWLTEKNALSTRSAAQTAVIWNLMRSE